MLYNFPPTVNRCIILYNFTLLGEILYNIMQFSSVFNCLSSNFRQIFNNFPAVFKPLKATYFLKWLLKKYHLHYRALKNIFHCLQILYSQGGVIPNEHPSFLLVWQWQGTYRPVFGAPNCSTKMLLGWFGGT